MATRPFSIHTVLTSILFERYEQSDGLKCKLDQEPNELTANLDSWFVLKDSAFSTINPEWKATLGLPSPGSEICTQKETVIRLIPHNK